MSIAELVSRNSSLAWTLSIAVLILGWLAFEDLPRLAEPRLTIREARVITPYPGASAAEVEGEVAEEIEEAVRSLEQVRRVESYSSRGLSVVRVLIADRYDRHALPEIWNQLRSRVADTQTELPPGAGPSTVEDEVGEVFGLYYGLVGAGFSPAELKRVADALRRELSTVEGVRKVALFGEQQETVLVEISLAKTKSLGLGLEEIFAALSSKNLPAAAGHIRIGPENVPIHPTGLFRSEQDLGDLTIAGDQNRLIPLGDIAEIRRAPADPPHRLLHIDGQPAIGIAVSAVFGADQVALGKAVERRIARLETDRPLGMEVRTIASAPSAIVEAIDGFSTYLIQALILVFAALLLTMGPHAGLAIGFVTLLTLAATFVVMDLFQISLNPVSMGALVMVSGMLASNAIFVVNGSKLRMERGRSGVTAAREAVAGCALPLLVSTAVLVLAFAPAGGMDGSAGEYTRGLFLVVLIALPISWAAALTVTPLLAGRLIRPGTCIADRTEPPRSRAQNLYARLLAAAIRRRWILLGATALLFVLSISGFGFVKQTSFPPSETSSFAVEVFFREGTHIRETERRMGEIQTYLREQAGVIQVATAIGAGHPRYLQTSPLRPDIGSHYGASLVLVDDKRRIEEIRHRSQMDLAEGYPDAIINAKRYAHGTGTAGGRIQLRLSGPDPSELRRMADRSKALVAADPDAKAVREDWGAKVKVAQPVLAGTPARRLGMDRARITRAMRTTYTGTLTGFYREGTERLPILVKTQGEGRGKVEDMAGIQVTSPLRGDRVSLRRLVDRLETVTEDARRIRGGGHPMITLHADADRGLPSELLERIRPRIERALDPESAADRGRNPGFWLLPAATSVTDIQNGMIPLGDKPDYYIGWGGEAADWAQAKAELKAWIPICLGLAVLAMVALFNGFRQPLIVLAAAPLPMIGATAGLLLSGRPFDLMALLGLVGITGSMFGNAVLMLDRIDREIRGGKVDLTAILQAAGGCLRPIGLAAGTAMLAMLPLLRSDLFASMAVAMISGLGFATLLLLVLVPVLCVSLFGIRDDETP